jgi:comEA protein
MKKKEGDNWIGLLFEKYRLWLGAILLLLIITESVYLLWRENYLTPAVETRISSLEEKISHLENTLPVSNQTAGIEVDKLISASSTDNTTEATPPPTTPKSTAKVPTITGKVNINTASAAELDLLPGIGPAYASKIIDYRQSHAGFKSIDEIKNVKGIGEVTFGKLKDLITI